MLNVVAEYMSTCLKTHRQRVCLDNYFAESTDFFSKTFDLLNERQTIAHGLFLKPDELAELAGATLVLNTNSNLRLISGITDGVGLGLGIDGKALRSTIRWFESNGFSTSVFV